VGGSLTGSVPLTIASNMSELDDCFETPSLPGYGRAAGQLDVTAAGSLQATGCHPFLPHREVVHDRPGRRCASGHGTAGGAREAP
jgi:hypothetical protein